MTDITLRKELRNKFEEILARFSDELSLPKREPLAEILADAALEVAGIAKRAISFDEDQADISWGIASGKPITDKALAKQKDKLEFENMLDKQLTRLGLNFSQFVEDDKERFRKFIAAERERGRELSAFVDWWLADEFRRIALPWKLDPIRQQWLKAFVQSENKPSEDYTGGKSFHL